MDYFIQFVLSFASYLIIAYFIYNILGRKRTVSIVILTVVLLSSVFEFLGVLRIGAEMKAIILFFMIRVLPVLFAFYVFMVITGGIPFFKFKIKRKTIKGISSDIQTKHFSTLISIYALMGSTVFGLLVYFFVDGYMKYIIISILGVAFIFSIYVILSNQKIIKEQVILIVGKNREHLYKYAIPKNQNKVLVSDFFVNDNYIVDPIGVAIIKREDKKIEKDYLYWIATSDKVDTSDSPLEAVYILCYSDELYRYEKYHYRSLTYQLSKTGRAELINNKKIK